MKFRSALPNPKRDRTSSRGRAGWYPYYAGFSADFAAAVLDTYCANKSSCVLDTWNGSGTTTATAASRGVESLGFDLNPVMSIVARARLLNKRERTSLIPLAKAALHNLNHDLDFTHLDPLLSWFTKHTVRAIRRIEQQIQSILLGSQCPASMAEYIQKNEFSDLAAFFYVALFRTVRTLAAKFQSSNPTWLRLPESPKECVASTNEEVNRTFIHNVALMENLLDADPFDKDGKVKIGVAPSSSVPVATQSVDFVLTSPPYCTRIDYAAATRVELAVLGVGEGDSFDTLRRQLIGTPTVPKQPPMLDPAWGKSCEKTLFAVQQHQSRASSTYYYKGLCQYFNSIHLSMNELHRCLKPSGKACLVVQDSFYKEIYIDLAKISMEMAEAMGLELSLKQDFHQKRNFAQVNPKSKKYRKNSPAIESVLLFTKI